MNADRWKQVDELLQNALRLPPEQRDEFLQHACGADAALRREVQSLLTSHQKAGTFLQRPAIDVAAQATATLSMRSFPHLLKVKSSPITAFSRSLAAEAWEFLQLARAYVMSGDRTHAKSAYEDFLKLWKDADPNIPILKQAKPEYARVQ
jgi:hypothetical protein